MGIQNVNAVCAYKMCIQNGHGECAYKIGMKNWYKELAWRMGMENGHCEWALRMGIENGDREGCQNSSPRAHWSLRIIIPACASINHTSIHSTSIYTNPQLKNSRFHKQSRIEV